MADERIVCTDGLPRAQCTLTLGLVLVPSLAAAVETKIAGYLSRLRDASYLRKWLVLGSLIGVVAGLGAIVFITSVELASRFFLEFLGGYHHPHLWVKATPLGLQDSLGRGPSLWSWDLVD